MLCTLKVKIITRENIETFVIYRYVVGVNLPDQNQIFEEPGTVSGWGTLDYDNPVFPNKLQSVEVPFVPEDGNIITDIN